MTMIEIHLLGEMVAVRVKASREQYDNIRENLAYENERSIRIGDFIFNYNHVVYMEYVEEK